MSQDFTFPVVAGAAAEPAKLPLTARSTVSHAAGSGKSEPQQAKMVADPKANLEHRNKGDPLLTRLVYSVLAWISNVPLEKGYSQVDWMRVSRATPAPKLRKDITMEEVAQHKTRDDAWMVFRNRVYLISPYLKYHPGGAEILMKVAGKDGTSLFMKYHPWVNIDALMEKCLIGLLAEGQGSGAAAAAPGSSSRGSSASGGSSVAGGAASAAQTAAAGAQPQGLGEGAAGAQRAQAGTPGEGGTEKQDGAAATTAGGAAGEDAAAAL